MKTLRKILDAALAHKFGGPLQKVGDKTEDVLDPAGTRIGLRSNSQRVVITLASAPAWKSRIPLCERTDQVAFIMPGLRDSSPDAFLVPAGRLDADFKASHKHWSRGRSANTKIRELRFSGDPETVYAGFAVKYAEFKIPLAPLAFEAVQRGPGGFDLVPIREALWIGLDDENRGVCGTHRDMCEQMRDFNINSDEVRGATLEDYIRGVLGRMGIEAPATPEIMIGALCARGVLRLLPPGCKLF